MCYTIFIFYRNYILSYLIFGVIQLMLDSWNQSIFNDIKQRLQDSAMKLVYLERNGEAFDSQLVIGVRESYGEYAYSFVKNKLMYHSKQHTFFFYQLTVLVNLCSNYDDKLQIYRDNFERAYIETTEAFYKAKAPEYLELHGVQNYMRYADLKLREEEIRAQKYLETNSGSVQMVLFSLITF